jgi:hypothetical protein
MELRSGKFIGALFPKENQPFKLICMQEKRWLCSSYEPKERKEPRIALSEAWSNWVHKTKKFREWILLENIEPDMSLDQRKEEKGPYEVNIDFDRASEEWRENKVQLGEAGFRYNK